MRGLFGGPTTVLAVVVVCALTVGCGSPPSVGPSPPTAATASEPEVDFAERRRQMVERDLRGRDVTDERVLAAMGRVPRQRFVPETYRDRAYQDRPLPIGFGQTISQPYIVAIMTQLLNLKPGEKVLEVGTGSGYQAAVLAELTPQVYTVEIVEPLAARAQAGLRELGHDGVKATVADGYFGWEEHAPFDAILVTCAPDHIPQPLLRQLAEGGRMVVPVGPPGLFQSLWRIEKKGDQLTSRNVMGVVFVPMTGAAEDR